MGSHVSLVTIGTVLVLGIVLVAQASRNRSSPDSPDAKQTLPAAVPPTFGAFRSCPKTISESRHGDQVVASVLQYDEALFREYSKTGKKFEMLIFRWRPGRVSQEIPLRHTPDSCWPEAGWKNTMQEHRVTRVGTVSIPSGELRCFKNSGGDLVHTLFWLIQDGQPYDWSYEYGDSIVARSTFFKGLRQMFGSYMYGHPEMYYVRVTSRAPIKQLGMDADFAMALSILKKIGVAEGR